MDEGEEEDHLVCLLGRDGILLGLGGGDEGEVRIRLAGIWMKTLFS